jgi:hypothetical protein
MSGGEGFAWGMLVGMLVAELLRWFHERGK